MAEIRSEEVSGLAKTLAEVLTEIEQLSHDVASAEEVFRKRALEAVERLNDFLKKLKITERYVDWPFYSEPYGAYNKWEVGYRLVLEDSQIKVEEYDTWRSYMYPETEDPVVSFDSLSVERLAKAIESIPEFLKYVAEKLNAKKEKYIQLASVAGAISSLLERAEG